MGHSRELGAWLSRTNSSIDNVAHEYDDYLYDETQQMWNSLSRIAVCQENINLDQIPDLTVT